MRVQRPNFRRRRQARLSFAACLLAMSILNARSGAVNPCEGWDLSPTPNVGNSVTRLTAVTALSANDAWSVGYWRDNPAGRGPLAMRWNGTAWSETSLPSTGQLGAYPETEGVDATEDGVSPNTQMRPRPNTSKPATPVQWQ